MLVLEIICHTGAVVSHHFPHPFGQDAAPPSVLDLNPLDPLPPAKSTGNLRRKRTEKDCEWKSIKEIPYMCVCKYVYVYIYIYMCVYIYIYVYIYIIIFIYFILF